MIDDNGIIRTEGEDLNPQLNKPLTTDDLIEWFLREAQKKMESSKNRYRSSLKIYFKWVESTGFNLTKITFSEILVYIKFLEGKRDKNDKPLSAYTIGSYLVAVKVFYNWAHAKGIYPINPCLTLELPDKDAKYPRQPLNETQIGLLFEHFKKQSVRDYAIIRTLYYCGLRTIELVRIDFGDIKIVDGVRRVWVQGKGKKSKNKWVKLRDEAYLPIMDYLKTRKDITDPIPLDTPVFVSESFIGKGERLTQGSISRIVKAGLVAIGLDSRKYTTHGIRSSAGTNAIRNGASLAEVQEMLRHASDVTTKGYVAQILDEKRNNEKSAEDYL